VAPALFAALSMAAKQILAGKDVAAALHDAHETLAAAGMAPDYVALVHAQSLEPLNVLQRPARIIAAARLGTVRLLDNVPAG